MDYAFELWQRVRLIGSMNSGEVTSRVPGNGMGTGFYYVTTDDGKECGPLTADELESE